MGIEVYEPIHGAGTEATSSVLFTISFSYAFLLSATEMSVTLGNILHFRAVTKG